MTDTPKPGRVLGHATITAVSGVPIYDEEGTELASAVPGETGLIILSAPLEQIQALGASLYETVVVAEVYKPPSTATALLVASAGLLGYLAVRRRRTAPAECSFGISTCWGSSRPTRASMGVPCDALNPELGDDADPGDALCLQYKDHHGPHYFVGPWGRELRSEFPEVFPQAVDATDHAGWKTLTRTFCSKLEALRGQNPDAVPMTVCVIKEKFGTLTIYLDRLAGQTRVAAAQEAYEEAAHQLTYEADLESAETCDACGEKGETRHERGWVRTLCDAHHASEPGLRGSGEEE